MSTSIEHSRAFLLASKATGADRETLEERLEDASVVVRIDAGLVGATLTARVLLTTLRRLPGRLSLIRRDLDDGTVLNLAAAVHAIDSTRPLTVLDEAPVDASVNIHIGLTATNEWVRLVPDGYGAQLATDAAVEMKLGRPGNALGSVVAAALGAAEAFKHVARVLPERRTIRPHVSFCPVTLTTDTTKAPELPDSLPIDIALIGNGAVGTAEALILSELALGGSIIACDPERYEPENRGTYSLGGEREGEHRPRKVDLTGDLLATAGYAVTKVEGKSTELIRRLDVGELRTPGVVLTGLDSIEARRETQGLWPDHLIDAQTGDTALGFCHAVHGGPCLRCFFPERHDGPSALDRLAQETGLPLDRLRRGQDALTEADISPLTQDQRQRLLGQLGKPVCGLANALGLTDADPDGYMPSVPFVSQMAACLGIGRLLAVRLGLATPANWLQFDALQGPRTEGDSRNPRRDCFCQTRRDVVERLRLVRRMA